MKDLKNLKALRLEELKKMASKNKIEGRSKMNKIQLVRALSKNKKMLGGALNNEQITSLVNRDYQQNPLYLSGIYTTPSQYNRSWKIVSVERYSDLFPNEVEPYINFLRIRAKTNRNNTDNRNNDTRSFQINPDTCILSEDNTVLMRIRD